MFSYICDSETASKADESSSKINAPAFEKNLL